MLQLRTRRFAYLPMAINCQWCFMTGYQMSQRKLTQRCFDMQFAFDIGFERVNIVTVDRNVAILEMYFQPMLNGKIIVTVDRNVAILEMYFQPMLNGKITFNMEHDQQRCYIHLFENSLDQSLVQALLGLHAFSGCNTISCYKRYFEKAYFLGNEVCLFLHVLHNKNCTY